MTLTLDLAHEVQRRLVELATKSGLTLEDYVTQVLEREAGGGQTSPLPALETAPDLADWERRLDELAEKLPPLAPLPADFSRAEVYGEHP